MKITWYGHSCFIVESGGYRVALDPYTLENYPPLHIQANKVLCSHEHRDHCFVSAVNLTEGGNDPFAVEQIPCFHDEKRGELRGRNTIHILEAEDLRVAHLGDLGHIPEDYRVFGRIDVLLIPVGGYYTIDAAAARQIADAIAPRITVPMHYRHGEYGLRPVGTAEDFLSLCTGVQRLDTNFFTVTKDTPHGVVIPAFCP